MALSNIAATAARRATRQLINPQGEPQRSYMWEWEINGLSSGLKHENLSFYTISVELPERRIQRIQSRYIGMTLSYSGSDESDKTMSVTVWDDERLTSLRFFDSWINHTNTPNDGVSVTKKSYTADVKLYLKNSFDLFTVLQVDLKNAFPFNRSTVELSYENNSILQYTIDFSYDHLFLNNKDYEQLGENGDSSLLGDIGESLGL